MNLFLTGATGFVGSHLLNRFICDGHKVTILLRPSSDTGRIVGHSDIEAIPPEQLNNIFAKKRFDAVVHAATCYGHAGQSVDKIFEANVALPVRLMALCRTHGVRLFVNTDTFFAAPENDYSHLDTYTMSKRHCLDWGRKFAESNGIALVNMRLFHVYGEKDNPEKFVPSIVQRICSNEPSIALTPATQQRDFIHVNDVCRAFSIILRAPAKGLTYHEVGCGQAVSIRTFVKMVKDIARSSSAFHFGALPVRDGEIMCAKADTASLATHGWTPQISLKEGISRLVAAYPSKKKSAIKRP